MSSVQQYEVNSYETRITTNGDLADIYYPISEANDSRSFPIALLLQGALVDKSNYSEYATAVASYGFTVVVPNHFNDNYAPPGFPEGFYSEQQQINETLEFIKSENTNLDSPIYQQVDIDSMVLLGHSYGGIVGMNAIEGNSIYPYSNGEYTNPEELIGGVFYGSDYNQLNSYLGQPEETQPIDNDVPIALIGGSLEGIATIDNIKETYDRLENSPKSFISISGGNHYSITNTSDDFPIPDPNNATLDREQGVELLALNTVAFLHNNVLQDANNTEYHSASSSIDSASVIDLTGLDAQSIDFTVNREAGFNNTVGLYKINADGSVVDPISGSLISPGQDGYKEAALANSLDISLATNNGQTQKISTELAGNSIYAPFIVVDGHLENASNRDVFFAYPTANSDGIEHIINLGDNNLGFEDLLNGGDGDFNDISIKFDFV